MSRGKKPEQLPRCDEFRSRSEEHTSELQSRLHLVCRLLLEKKKKETMNQLADSGTACPRGPALSPARHGSYLHEGHIGYEARTATTGNSTETAALVDVQSS